MHRTAALPVATAATIAALPRALRAAQAAAAGSGASGGRHGAIARPRARRQGAEARALKARGDVAARQRRGALRAELGLAS